MLQVPRLLFSLLLYLPLLGNAVSSTGGHAGYNIFDNYCNRLYIQSTLKNETIWIDGGLQSFAQWQDNNSLLSYTATAPTFNATNPYLIQIPMQSSWDWKTNITETAIDMSAPNPNTGTSPPQIYQGALYHGEPSDSKLWLYGGTYSWLAQNMSWFLYPDSQHYPLWSYDTSDNQWTQYDLSSVAPMRPSHGYATEAADQGLGFYFNGKIDNGSAAETAPMQDQVVFLEGMIVLNLLNGTARNISTSSVTQGDARVGGQAQYISRYGGHGLILFFGGGEKSVQDRGSDTYGALLPMDEILLFDIASLYSVDVNATDSGWYIQNATGDAPEPRADFCIVGVTAPDDSSYTIYLYGGRNQTTAFDDIYALTLPAFVWTKVYFEGMSPRYGHDCHLITDRQMITLGGAETLKLDQCDWEVKGIAVYDISENQWGSVYVSSLTNYTIPASITSVIGGSSTGNATFTSPAAGWADEDIANVFGQTLKATLSRPSSSHSKLSGGDIAGIVVALVIVLVATTAIVLYWFLVVIPRRKYQREGAAEVHGTSATIHEMETANSAVHEMPNSFAVCEKDAQDDEVTNDGQIRELPGDYSYTIELPGDEARLDPNAILGQR